MKYYILETDEGFDWIWSKEIELRRFSMDFEGLPMNTDWKEIEVDYVDKGNRDFDICVATSPLYILSKKSANLLENILIEYGELLPMKSPNNNYVGFHCTNIISNALIIKDCEIDWLDKDEGWINGIKEYAFDNEKIKNSLIFRVPSKYSYETFFSEKLKLIIEENKLKGFVFKEI
ncbi:hypothetical protein G1K75_12790 [Tenacibaculum finnmarkense]|uniref:imm11 family protein n=1 Tax=Tenacibaculum finnmarkense TaxID=2781243 RepID=UPI001E621A7B|nr:DUF1629 domain-containing protein [Tenacibaculum finnmarkense]MCD8401329.1 hypothetical protein [Tenacibaculum finnmarkense genomovar ulcerans]MCG8806529.1 hypothetical protein [Tenacibaculum finnmarkense]MCG8857676.1 hypothetical protein [Tenacibaculum finnmarkense]WCC41198.1 hypothetical protein PJJ26_00140 [Tenacibaculum finnmarkense]